MTVLQDIEQVDMSAEEQQVAPVENSQGEDAYGMATANMAFGSQYIGSITHVEGTVYIFRGDQTIEAEEGTKLMEGDTVKTMDGTVNLEFMDESQFSMGDNGRMVLDEMVYDPAEQTGSLNFSMTDGAFGFISGMIAKTDPDAMMLNTPVATIGIRGTEGLIDLYDGFKVILLEEDNGFVGEIVVTSNGKVFVLNEQNQFTTVINNELQEPIVLEDDQIVDEFGEIVDIQDEASVLDEEILELDNEEAINVQLDGEHEYKVDGSDAIIEEDASNGILEVNADGTYKYTPEAGFVGEDKFTIKYINAEGVEVTETITVYVDDWAGFNDFQTDAGGPNGFDEDFINVTDDLNSEEVDTTDPTTPNSGDTNNDSNTSSDTGNDTGTDDTPTGDAGTPSGGTTDQSGGDDGNSDNGGSDTTDPDPTDPSSTDPIVTVTTETRTESITGTETFKSSTNTVSVERENDLENNREVVDTTTTTTNVYETPTTVKTYDVEIVTTTDADGNVLNVEENVVLSGEETTYETREEVLTDTEITYEEPVTTVEYVTTTEVVRGNEVLTDSAYYDEATVENDLDTNREVTTTERTYTDTYQTEVITTTTTTPVYTITYSNGVTETEQGEPTVNIVTDIETRENVHVDEIVTYEDASISVEYQTNVETVTSEPVVTTETREYTERDIDYDNDRERINSFIETTTTTSTTTLTTTTTTPVYTVMYPDGSVETEYGTPVIDTATSVDKDTDVTVEAVDTTYEYPEITVTEDVQTYVQTDGPNTETTYEDITDVVQNEDGTETETVNREYTDVTTTTTTTVTTTTPTTTLTYSDGSTETVVGDPVITTNVQTETATDVRVEVLDEDTTPFAGEDTFTGAEDVAMEFTLDDILENDYDVDGDTLELVSFEQPDNGALEYDADTQTFTFTPNDDWNGTTSFGYTISADGDEVSSTVNLEVDDDLTDPGEPNYEDPDDGGPGNSDFGHEQGGGSDANNGFGNGDQEAPGNSLDNNNAENTNGEDMMFMFGIQENGDIMDNWVNSDGDNIDPSVDNQDWSDQQIDKSNKPLQWNDAKISEPGYQVSISDINDLNN